MDIDKQVLFLLHKVQSIDPRVYWQGDEQTLQRCLWRSLKQTLTILLHRCDSLANSDVGAPDALGTARDTAIEIASSSTVLSSVIKSMLATTLTSSAAPHTRKSRYYGRRHQRSMPISAENEDAAAQRLKKETDRCRLVSWVHEHLSVVHDLVAHLKYQLMPLGWQLHRECFVQSTVIMVVRHLETLVDLVLLLFASYVHDDWQQAVPYFLAIMRINEASAFLIGHSTPQIHANPTDSPTGYATMAHHHADDDSDHTLPPPCFDSAMNEPIVATDMACPHSHQAPAAAASPISLGHRGIKGLFHLPKRDTIAKRASIASFRTPRAPTTPQPATVAHEESPIPSHSHDDRYSSTSSSSSSTVSSTSSGHDSMFPLSPTYKDDFSWTRADAPGSSPPHDATRSKRASISSIHLLASPSSRRTSIHISHEVPSTQKSQKSQLAPVRPLLPSPPPSASSMEPCDPFLQQPTAPAEASMPRPAHEQTRRHRREPSSGASVRIHTEYALPTFIHPQHVPARAQDAPPRHSLKSYRSETDLRRLRSIFIPNAASATHLTTTSSSANVVGAASTPRPLSRVDTASSTREKSKQHPILSSMMRSFGITRTNSHLDHQLHTPHGMPKSESSSWNLWRQMRRHPSLANLRKAAQGRDHDDEPPTPCVRATPFSDLMLATKSGEGSILHLSENGHDVLLMERIDGRFQVLAGTTEKLFLKLADETVQDFDYVDAYILNHTEFTTSDVFLENLMSRFYLEALPGELAYFYKWQHNIQTKVLHVISRWIKLQFIDFINNPILLTRLRAFVTGDVTRGGFAAEARSIRDLLDSQDAQHNQPRHVIIQAVANVNVRQHAPVIASHRAQPLSPSMALVPAILAMAPKEIAQYLTLADFYLLKCITPFDLLEHVRKHKHQQPRCHGDYIERLTRRANQLSHWVQQMIQLQPSSRHRRLVLRKIIDVAKHCLEFHNFHTSMLLTTSLLQPAIQKLTEWSGVSGHEDVASLMRLLDVSNNMHAYRGALAQAKAPLVPFFPLLLKDLTFIMDGNAPVYQEDTSNAAPGPLTATNASMAPSSSPAAAQASSSSFSGAASAVTGLGGDTSACATNGCHDDLINFSKYRTLTHCLHGVLRATYDDYAFSSQLGDWAFLTPNQPRLHTLPDHAYPLDHVAWLMEQSLWASSPASSSSSSSSSPSSSTSS